MEILNLFLGATGVTIIVFVIGIKVDLTWLKEKVSDPILILWLLSWFGGLAIFAILEWIFSAIHLLTGAFWGGIPSFVVIALARAIAEERRKPKM